MGKPLVHHPEKGWRSTLDQQSPSIEKSDKAKAISFTNNQ